MMTRCFQQSWLFGPDSKLQLTCFSRFFLLFSNSLSAWHSLIVCNWHVSCMSRYVHTLQGQYISRLGMQSDTVTLWKQNHVLWAVQSLFMDRKQSIIACSTSLKYVFRTWIGLEPTSFNRARERFKLWCCRGWDGLTHVVLKDIIPGLYSILNPKDRFVTGFGDVDNDRPQPELHLDMITSWPDAIQSITTWLKKLVIDSLSGRYQARVTNHLFFRNIHIGSYLTWSTLPYLAGMPSRASSGSHIRPYSSYRQSIISDTSFIRSYRLHWSVWVKQTG